MKENKLKSVLINNEDHIRLQRIKLHSCENTGQFTSIASIIKELLDYYLERNKFF